MRLLISGYRYFSDPQVISEEILRELDDIQVRNSKLLESKEVTVLHGDCPTGVDASVKKLVLDGTLAKLSSYKFLQVPFSANWKKYDRGAGPIRNRQMITEGKPDYAIIFLSPKSTGTLNMKHLLDEYRIGYTEVQVGNEPYGLFS